MESAGSLRAPRAASSATAAPAIAPPADMAMASAPPIDAPLPDGRHATTAGAQTGNPTAAQSQKRERGYGRSILASWTKRSSQAGAIGALPPRGGVPARECGH